MTTSKRVRVFIRQDLLLREMARKNISQNGLARALRVTSGYMSQLLRGVRSPSPELRDRLQVFLKIDDFDQLFRITGSGGARDV